MQMETINPSILWTLPSGFISTAKLVSRSHKKKISFALNTPLGRIWQPVQSSPATRFPYYLKQRTPNIPMRRCFTAVANYPLKFPLKHRGPCITVKASERESVRTGALWFQAAGGRKTRRKKKKTSETGVRRAFNSFRYRRDTYERGGERAREKKGRREARRNRAFNAIRNASFRSWKRSSDLFNAWHRG